MRRAVLLVLLLILGGCADVPGQCDLDLAHHDCPPYGYAHPVPADDTICRSYGLQRGTADYAQCRTVKSAAEKHTRDGIDSAWRPGLIPFL